MYQHLVGAGSVRNHRTMSITTYTGESPRTAIEVPQIENSDGCTFYRWGADGYETTVKFSDPTAGSVPKPVGYRIETILFVVMSRTEIFTSYDPHEIVYQLPGDAPRVFHEPPEFGQQMNGVST